MRIPLAVIADEDLLKRVWKSEVRPAIRKMTLSDLNLAPDPLHYAGYEWGLEGLVAALAKDLRSGRYSPERGEIVRAAKSKGLSRPLCFLATRDALVYRTITWLARDQLMTFAQEWVGVAHSDKGSSSARPDDDAADSFDWFRFWLARQGHIIKMVDNPDVEYFVESDIANFYPSIRLEAIREHLHSQTDLEKEVVRLCVQIIDGVMPRRDYSEVSLMGLPQEQIGSSRDIAHSLLAHVDKEFEEEGVAGRYTRYMDDILIGVPTVQEGEKCISRLQRSLETLGLYPNAAKTVVTGSKDYLQDAMVSTNAEIDRLTHALEKHGGGRLSRAALPVELLEEIQALSSAHRAILKRPKRWDRVTRRLYTLHRTVGIRDWQHHWIEDVFTDPGAASAILEYVRSWPLDKASVAGLVRVSSALGGLYANISLLCAEALATAPVTLDEDLWQHIYDTANDELIRLISEHPRTLARERLAAGWLVAAWKFADDDQREQLLARVPANSDALSPVRVQAFPLLAAAGHSLSEWVAAKPGLAWENAMAAEYLRSLQNGEDKAVGVAINLLNPELRLKPQRYAMLPRAVPLAEIIARSASERIRATAPKMLAKLQKNSARLRDHRNEMIVARYSR
jgi:hypothetical protein